MSRRLRDGCAMALFVRPGSLSAAHSALDLQMIGEVFVWYCESPLRCAREGVWA
jgi:hypothetical protein